jgi:hypothetical protein
MSREIPRYSQYLDVRDERWRSRSCGIVALKMVLDYWHSVHPLRIPPPTLAALLRRAYAAGAYVRNVGWSHRGLAAGARSLGLAGRNFDWAALPPRAAFKKLLPLVHRGPVIASVYLDSRTREGGHLVVMTDVTRTHVRVLDPAAKSRTRIRSSITIPRFLLLWKRRVIVIRPRLRKTR